MRINDRIKRLEKVRNDKKVVILVGWIDGDVVTVESDGEKKDITLNEWEAMKEEQPDGVVFEAIWLD